jgi:thiol-disulfide isomerase/thioredoxin
MRMHCISALLLTFGSSHAAHAAPVVGEQAPALVAPASEKRSAVDLAHWRGKTVLVSYWATWCEPCKREMPILEALYRSYHDRGLEVLLISIDFPRDQPKARAAMRTFPFPAVHVSDLTADGFGKPRGLPTGYLVDAQGIVRDAFASIRQDDMQKTLDTLLTTTNH